MGTKFAPTYFTLVVGFLDETLYKETEKHVRKDFSNYPQKTWNRYLDDSFTFWIKDTDQLNTLIEILKINNETLPFLDILISKTNATL